MKIYSQINKIIHNATKNEEHDNHILTSLGNFYIIVVLMSKICIRLKIKVPIMTQLSSRTSPCLIYCLCLTLVLVIFGFLRSLAIWIGIDGDPRHVDFTDLQTFNLAFKGMGEALRDDEGDSSTFCLTLSEGQGDTLRDDDGDTSTVALPFAPRESDPWPGDGFVPIWAGPSPLLAVRDLLLMSFFYKIGYDKNNPTIDKIKYWKNMQHQACLLSNHVCL